MAPLRSDILARGVVQDIKSLDATSLAALRPVMAEAQREIAADLSAWAARLGPDALGMRYTSAHLLQLQKLLGVAQGAAGVTKRKGYAAAARAAVLKTMGQAQAPRRAARTIVAQLEDLASRFSDMSPPQLLHAAILARGDRMVLNRYPASAQRYMGQVQQDLQFQLGVGLAKNETIFQLTNRIANLSSFQASITPSTSPADAGRAMGNGLGARYQHSAERLVRTEVANAYNYTARQGILAAHHLDNRIVMRWDAANDLRVCPRCRAMHGDDASPTGTFSGGVQHPPLHPHCRCAIIAWMSEWKDELQPVSAQEMLREETDRAVAANEANRVAKAAEAAAVKAEGRSRRPR